MAVDKIHDSFVAGFTNSDRTAVRLVSALDPASRNDISSFVVVKFMGTNYSVRTVKFWRGSYTRTVASWNTSLLYVPSIQDHDVAQNAIKEARQACAALLNSGSSR